MLCNALKGFHHESSTVTSCVLHSKGTYVITGLFSSTGNFSVVEDICVINVDGLFTMQNRKVMIILLWHIVFHSILS